MTLQIPIYRPQEKEQFDALREFFNIRTNAQLVRYCINECYALHINGQTERIGKKANAGGSPRSPGRPPKIEGTETKKEKRYRLIAEALNGKIDRGSVTYTIYETIGGKRVDEFEQTLPLDFMDEHLIKEQYKPDRETVERVLKTQNK